MGSETGLSQISTAVLTTHLETLAARHDEYERKGGLQGFMSAGVYAAQLNMIEAELDRREAEAAAPKFLSAYPDSFAA